MMTKDVEKIASVLNSIPEIRAICIDVANGYSEHFVEFVKEIRTKFPEHIVIVSWCNLCRYRLAKVCQCH